MGVLDIINIVLNIVSFGAFSFLLPLLIIVFTIFFLIFGSLKNKKPLTNTNEAELSKTETPTEKPKTNETNLLERTQHYEQPIQNKEPHLNNQEKLEQNMKQTENKEKPKLIINFQKVEDPQEEERRKKKNELINMINFILDKYGKREDFYTLPEHIRTLNPDEFKAYAKENFKKN